MKAKDIIEFFKQWRANKNFPSPCSLEDQSLCSAVSSAIPLISKHIPKAPLKRSYEDKHYIWECPTCKQQHKTKKMPNYCDHCGQALDWTDERYKLREKADKVDSIEKVLSEAKTRNHLASMPPIKRNQSENTR